jgi:signal transduction histidine kinase
MTTNIDVNATSLEREELIARLRWFIRLRWLFGGGLVAIGVLFTYNPFHGVRGQMIATIGGAILVYNCVFQYVERWLLDRYPTAHANRAPLAAVVQIVLDLIAITLVLNAAGGVENPFFIFYIFHMVIATLLLPAVSAFILAALAILLFSGLALGEMAEFWPHAALFAGDDRYSDPRFVTITLAAFSSALLIAVYLGTSIAKQLRSREREVLHLRSELAGRAEQLEQTNQALRDLDAAKVRYYRKVSHELKTPLSAQRSLLGASLVELKNVATEEMLGRIRRAMARGDDLLTLVNDLMLLSQTREMRRRPVAERIQPMEQLKPLLDDQALRAKEKGLSWQIEANDSLPEISLEPRTLPMLAENLISNAIKYTPAGGQVTFLIRSENGHLVIEVQDTGIGIGSEDLSRIGQEFFRTRQAKDSLEGGTGLGMTIVCSLVEAANGEIDIRSELDKGTRVTVRLPLNPPTSLLQ